MSLRAALNSVNGEKVAIKKIGNAFDNIIDAKRTLREIKLLRHMNQENVIAIKDIVKAPQRDIFNDVYIVYELMDTDLQRILRSNQTLSHDQCRVLVYQPLRGLKNVHSANILHRDLRLSNVLLNSKHKLKIGDFGLARTTSDTDFITEYVVTRYTAPELLLNCSEYTSAIDGSPDNSSLSFFRSDNAIRYVRQLSRYPKQQFAARFSKMQPSAIDLLEKILAHRKTFLLCIVDEPIGHAYLSSHHDVDNKPVCPTPFSFDFEHLSCTEEHIKELIYKEFVKFSSDH
ncbi:unnamed protein product [Eruca vesicaria subsp. sativa]|uniref:mitogen-activated protein kinase n=1 Tax=Eruca vesicaria subsp. sativa TaxID=29727 RepID=A0ABC8LKG7_ERUVS|nr:unnamed protein product [Eruca vesicaria subsp. sativa]